MFLALYYSVTIYLCRGVKPETRNRSICAVMIALTLILEYIRTYYSLLSFVNEAEDSTRRYDLARYEMNDEEIHKLPLRA